MALSTTVSPVGDMKILTGRGRLNRYVSIKIIAATRSGGIGGQRENSELGVLRHITAAQEHVQSSHPGARHVLTLWDDFEIAGPNGTHDCLVHEVLGPSIVQVAKESGMKRLNASVARETARQIVLGLGWLRSLGVAHGGKLISLVTSDS